MRSLEARRQRETEWNLKGPPPHEAPSRDREATERNEYWVRRFLSQARSIAGFEVGAGQTMGRGCGGTASPDKPVEHT